MKTIIDSIANLKGNLEVFKIIVFIFIILSRIGIFNFEISNLLFANDKKIILVLKKADKFIYIASRTKMDIVWRAYENSVTLTGVDIILKHLKIHSVTGDIIFIPVNEIQQITILKESMDKSQKMKIGCLSGGCIGVIAGLSIAKKFHDDDSGEVGVIITFGNFLLDAIGIFLGGGVGSFAGGMISSLVQKNSTITYEFEANEWQPVLSSNEQIMLLYSKNKNEHAYVTPETKFKVLYKSTKDEFKKTKPVTLKSVNIQSKYVEVSSVFGAMEIITIPINQIKEVVIEGDSSGIYSINLDEWEILVE
jgi:hypothetical protein